MAQRQHIGSSCGEKHDAHACGMHMQPRFFFVTKHANRSRKNGGGGQTQTYPLLMKRINITYGIWLVAWRLTLNCERLASTSFAIESRAVLPKQHWARSRGPSHDCTTNHRCVSSTMNELDRDNGYRTYNLQWIQQQIDQMCSFAHARAWKMKACAVCSLHYCARSKICLDKVLSWQSYSVIIMSEASISMCLIADIIKGN